jgi:hypothetical protein
LVDALGSYQGALAEAERLTGQSLRGEAPPARAHRR